MPLILTRQRGEKVKIGDEITVTIAKIGARRISLIIDAPENVRIRRDEIPSDKQRKDSDA